MKYIGNAGGKLHPMKPNPLTTTKRVVISNYKVIGSVAKNIIMAIITSSTINSIAEVKKSGSFIFFEMIFLIILPFVVVKPV